MSNLLAKNASERKWQLKEKLGLIDKISCDKRFTYAERVVAIAMVCHFHNSTNGRLFPSRAQICERTGTTKDVAIAATRKMKRFGYLDYKQSNGGCNQRNSYNLEKPVDNLAETVEKIDPNGRKNRPLTVEKIDPQISGEYIPSNISSNDGIHEDWGREDRNNNLGANTPSRMPKVDSLAQWQNGVSRRADGFRIPHGTKQYEAHRSYLRSRNSPDLYKFPDKPGHVVIWPWEWPPKYRKVG
jgi:hypothetical protein